MTAKELRLIIQPRIIDHLGIKMYQKPADVLAEIIANSWDADAEKVDIIINETEISITDNGMGMTFDECQQYFLQVGRNRRNELNSDVSPQKKRPVLGRKGIGKFSAFGIAKVIIVDTIAENHEHTIFELNIDDILAADAVENPNKKVNVLCHEIIAEGEHPHGTKVLIKQINPSIALEMESLKHSLSRRFILPQTQDDFIITLNGKELPESFNDEMEFVFPRDFNEKETRYFSEIITIDLWGYAQEKLPNGQDIFWRVGFFEETIRNEELRGISVFTRGKLAQKPFFFDLTGGIPGQNALEYMTGQVRIDFIDEGENDLIATERQRINLQSDTGRMIRDWGIKKIKKLSALWKIRRAEKRTQEIEDKFSEFNARLNALLPHERKTIKAALQKIASIPKLSKKRFEDTCSAVLTSWETGRLRQLVDDIASSDDLDEDKMIDLLLEADVLTALNIAEAIKTKITAVGELKEFVSEKQYENKIRDFIYEKPWIINPRWEKFTKETKIATLLKQIADEHLAGEHFNGRVDMVLSTASSLMLIEFIRPGKRIDADHLDRINYYVIEVKQFLKNQTGMKLRYEGAYLIGDSINLSSYVQKRIEQLEGDNILVMDWDTLIGCALNQWNEFIGIIKERNPNDKRIQKL